jgi:triosephosphate isomerase (TIM)
VDTRPLLVANFKMYLAEPEVATYLNRFKPLVFATEGRAIVIAPAFTSLRTAAILTERSQIQVAAQDVHPELEGAFTGSVSARMLASVGCRYVLVGHSERRQGAGEDDALVARKLRAAMSARLTPVLCVGESLEERQRGVAATVVARQIEAALAGLPGPGDRPLVIAYEPVWAIGTGEVATAEQVAEMHAHIRSRVGATFPGDPGAGVRVIYGGSVTVESAGSLLAIPTVNGLLVGGASRDPERFAAICNTPLG